MSLYLAQAREWREKRASMQSPALLRYYTTRTAVAAAAAGLLTPFCSSPIYSKSLISPSSLHFSAMKASTTTSQKPSPFISNLTLSLSSASDSINSVGDPTSHLVVVSFYKFADFPDHANFRNPIKQLCQDLVIVILSSSFYLFL